MTLDDDAQHRAGFMRRLYEETEGSYFATVDRDIIAARIGIESFEADRIVDQLGRAAFIEVGSHSYDRDVRLTDAGRREVEQSRAQLAQPPEIVQAGHSVTIEGDFCGNLQSGTVGSSQDATFDLAGQRSAIDGFLAALRDALDQHRIPEYERDNITADLETAETELRRSEPRRAILREALSALRDLVIGIGSSGAYAGLVELAQHIRL
jgi:DNA-binding MarR family transcriptional regulator